MASEWGARDFVEQPLTVEEMAQAVERAWQQHLAQVIEPDQHAIALQEAAKALRRAWSLQEASEEVAALLQGIASRIGSARAALSLAQMSKPDGREL